MASIEGMSMTVTVEHVTLQYFGFQIGPFFLGVVRKVQVPSDEPSLQADGVRSVAEVSTALTHL